MKGGEVNMTLERELLKGNTPAMVLAVLRAGPLHGYGIAREIERRSGDLLKFREGTLYPALHALERDGLVVGQWEVQPSGPARKVYALTKSGRLELDRRTCAWQAFSVAVSKVIGGEAHEQTT